MKRLLTLIDLPKSAFRFPCTSAAQKNEKIQARRRRSAERVGRHLGGYSGWVRRHRVKRVGLPGRTPGCHQTRLLKLPAAAPLPSAAIDCMQPDQLAVPVAPGFGPCSRHRLDRAPPARICAQPYGGLLREASLPKLFPSDIETPPLRACGTHCAGLRLFL